MRLANGRAKIYRMFAALIVLAVLTLLLHMTVDRASAVAGWQGGGVKQGGFEGRCGGLESG